MRWAMLLCAALLLTAVVRGQGLALSAAERNAGSLILYDGKSTFGWTIRGDAKVADQRLHLSDKTEAKLDALLPAGSFLYVAGRNVVLRYSQDGKVSEAGPDNDEDFVRSVEFSGKSQSLRRLALVAKENAQIRAVKLQLRLDMKPLFNGKDTDGWTVFPGKKSKFEVKDGELQILDGPGDLQTTGKYKNFILQLECKSNGKHLNSGVFFRCRANEYQNGYECQIQNGFGKEKEYDVDVFDPMTHKLFEKRKVKSGAIDYGTGAIYRRVPARSEVAKDHEWFTLTVLAVDNHFATWVDGIQQVDWTDNRPANDNARNGYRAEAGHISLQGHDPTTNLSFRNIRIQELP